MEYSAVTQPSPLPLRQRGTPSVNEAAQSTRVRPNSTRTEPSAWSSQPRLNVTGRSWLAVRPSERGLGAAAVGGVAVTGASLNASPGCGGRGWKSISCHRKPG